MADSTMKDENLDPSSEATDYNIMNNDQIAASEEDIRNELNKTEEDIALLRHALALKVQRANELKRQLGITPMEELKHDFQYGLKTIKESHMMQKMKAASNVVSSQASNAYSSLSSRVGNMIADLKTKPAIQSAEDKLYNVKARIVGSKTYESLRHKMNANGNADGLGEHEPLHDTTDGTADELKS